MKLPLLELANRNQWDKLAREATHSHSANEKGEALLIATQANATEAALALINAGASLDWIYVESKNTMLHCAAYNGNTQLVKALLAAEASIAARNSDGDAPIVKATLQEKWATVKAFAEARPLNEQEKTAEYSREQNRGAQYGHALLDATQANATEAALALINAGASLDWVYFNSKNTPLHCATYNGNTQLVKALLAAGASITARNSDDDAPIVKATLQEKWATVKAFAEARPLNEQEKTAEYSPEQNYGAQYGRALLDATRANVTEAALALINAGASLGWVYVNSKNTPLHCAAYNGNTQLVKALLEAGANFKAINKEGYTPLRTAIIEGHKEVAKVLSIYHKADWQAMASQLLAQNFVVDPSLQEFSAILQTQRARILTKLKTQLDEATSFDVASMIATEIQQVKETDRRLQNLFATPKLLLATTVDEALDIRGLNKLINSLAAFSQKHQDLAATFSQLQAHHLPENSLFRPELEHICSQRTRSIELIQTESNQANSEEALSQVEQKAKSLQKLDRDLSQIIPALCYKNENGFTLSEYTGLDGISLLLEKMELFNQVFVTARTSAENNLRVAAKKSFDTPNETLKAQLQDILTKRKAVLDKLQAQSAQLTTIEAVSTFCEKEQDFNRLDQLLEKALIINSESDINAVGNAYICLRENQPVPNPIEFQLILLETVAAPPTREVASSSNIFKFWKKPAVAAGATSANDASNLLSLRR